MKSDAASILNQLDVHATAGISLYDPNWHGGVVGILAFAANFGVAALLYRFRDGDSNMRSVWICSRNDAIGNVAVVAAAFGVFGTGSAWPDLTVAAILATLGISGGIQIMRQAAAELRAPHLLHAAPAQPILQGE